MLISSWLGNRDSGVFMLQISVYPTLAKIMSIDRYSKTKVFVPSDLEQKANLLVSMKNKQYLGNNIQILQLFSALL